jgi:hypothetical protein
MQTFTIEVNDNIADKILWLLNSFKNDVKIIKEGDTDITPSGSIKKNLDNEIAQRVAQIQSGEVETKALSDLTWIRERYVRG